MSAFAGDVVIQPLLLFKLIPKLLRKNWKKCEIWFSLKVFWVIKQWVYWFYLSLHWVSLWLIWMFPQLLINRVQQLHDLPPQQYKE
jgi:hypothetical protein